MSHPAAIPNYLLYGEANDEILTGFGHIETIAERSALHDWEIAPHRHEHSVQVLLITEGTVSVSLDGVSVDLGGPAYVIVPAGAVHGFRFSPGACGHVLTLGQDFAARASDASDPLRRLLAHGGHGALTAAIARHAEVLAGELLDLSSSWLAETKLFHALSEALLRALPTAAETERARDDDRISRFRHLVETHLREQRPVAFYARSLGVTERTLTRLCSKHLHCTPHEAINRRCAIEAQRLLRYTNANVTQVASELGFSDPSYFSRFYLRMTGRRPRTERD
jgi:AraC family transcriptional activator of pobA